MIVVGDWTEFRDRRIENEYVKDFFCVSSRIFAVPGLTVRAMGEDGSLHRLRRRRECSSRMLDCVVLSAPLRAGWGGRCPGLRLVVGDARPSAVGKSWARWSTLSASTARDFAEGVLRVNEMRKQR
jgi:predicted alpha/beta hydrolase